MPKPKILIIEDERSLIDILSYNLSREGFDVSASSDGAEGLRRAQASVPDLVLLDLMLPGLDGLQICRQLRSDPKTQGIRILMVTAKSEEVDEIVGFNMGADDYVAKPFKIKPLISRIKALLRRPSVEPVSGEVISVAGIEVDRTLHTATLDGEEMQLTPTEFKMLWTLMRRPGRPYSRNELLDNARGEDANALERTIDVHVRSLRQKLGDRGCLIETVRGIGYRFKAE
ncbi:MAG: response regulator transcription factor [Planctomycetes bacterium]|nr:response regulator transcription factor [Planctomycetota bacterium]